MGNDNTATFTKSAGTVGLSANEAGVSIVALNGIKQRSGKELAECSLNEKMTQNLSVSVDFVKVHILYQL